MIVANRKRIETSFIVTMKSACGPLLTDLGQFRAQKNQKGDRLCFEDKLLESPCQEPRVRSLCTAKCTLPKEAWAFKFGAFSRF